MTPQPLFDDLPLKDCDTWLTPEWIYSNLGAFDLDPCAAQAYPDRIAPHCYTVVDDGLCKIWRGRVFLNPPFSQLDRWLHEMVEHNDGIAVVPVAVENELWHKYVWSRASAVLFLKGRTKFVLPNGKPSEGRPRFSIALVAYGPNNRRALATSGLAGVFIPGWVA